MINWPRRALAGLLAGIFLSGLTACGGGGGSTNAAATAPVVTPSGGTTDDGSGSTGSTDTGDLPVINGAVNEVTWSDDQVYRYVVSNGIPDHEVGEFPNSGNPNTISEQNHSYKMAYYPVETGMYDNRLFAMAINGVLMEPGTGEFYNNDRTSGWNYEALTGFLNLGADFNNAHVQPTGNYHYHGMPEGLIEVISGTEPAQTLVGYAADGFPVYARYGLTDPADAGSELIVMTGSYDLKKGLRPSGPGGAYDGTFTEDFEYVADSGLLDECNGRVGVTPEYPDGTYHYYVTDDFPFAPRCLKGLADTTFDRAGP